MRGGRGGEKGKKRGKANIDYRKSFVPFFG